MAEKRAKGVNEHEKAEQARKTLSDFLEHARKRPDTHRLEKEMQRALDAVPVWPKGLNDKVVLDVQRQTHGVFPRVAKELRRALDDVAALARVPSENLFGVSSAPLPKQPRLQRGPGVGRHRVFVCYSRKDSRHLQKLTEILEIFTRNDDIDWHWNDTAIIAGDDWDNTILRRIEAADVFLMLVSAASLSSDYIRRVEMKRALERHAAGEAVFVPILLEECIYDKSPLRKLQYVPSDKPISRWKPHSNAWKVVANHLDEVFNRLRSVR